MVHKAIQEVRKKSDSDKFNKLLVVEVHGPSLLTPLPVVKSPKADKDDPLAKEVEQVAKLNKEKKPTIDSLMVLTLALYRCFSRELTDNFRKAKIPESLVARLDLELEKGASPEQLGVFWRKAGLLDDPKGYRELVALDSASQAYQKVIGIITGKDTLTEDNESTLDMTSELKSEALGKKLKAAFKEIWSLVGPV